MHGTTVNKKKKKKTGIFGVVSHCTVLLKTGIDFLVIGQFSKNGVRMYVT
jgi:hypothetical protein